MKDKNMGRMEEKKIEEPKEEAGNSLHAKKKKKEKYLGTRREIQVTSSILVALPEVDKKHAGNKYMASTSPQRTEEALSTLWRTLDTLQCEFVVQQLQDKAVFTQD